MSHDGGTRRFDGPEPGDDRTRRVEPGRGPHQQGPQQQGPQQHGARGQHRQGPYGSGPQGPGDDRTRRVGPPQGSPQGPPPGPPPGRDDRTRFVAGSPADGHTRAFHGGDADAPTGYLGGPPSGRQGPPTDGTRRMAGAASGDADVVAGRYRLEGLLGSGGMADVHRATDLNLDRPVAIKIFRPGTDPAGEQRFREEARLTANLSNPGLVAVHDFGVADHHLFLVMELVDGRTLHELLDRGAMPTEEVTRLGAEVADALAYVHQQGVVHRDVKPSNILVTRAGRARLADFGISRMAGQAGLTEGGGTLGTAAYMAPEQVRGGRVGPPADVYSLGLVLLEALTGEVEYPGDGYETAAERLGRPPLIPEDLPPSLHRLLSAMTATDQNDRPTAVEVAATLREDPHAAAAVPVQHEPEEPRSRRGMVIAAVVLLLAIIVGIALFTGGDDEQQAAPVPSTDAPVPPGEQPLPEPAPEPEPAPDQPAPQDPGTAPTTDDGGFLPDLPDFPSFPDLPDASNFPEVPEGTELPDTQQLEDEGRNVFERFRDWVSSWF